MSSATTLLAELEDAVASGNSERRTGMLRMITDLFLDAADAYSDEQVGVFDDVMGRLADKANVDARAELAVRLAPVAQAPSGVVTKLAVDDELRVAEPVLRQSPCLDDAFLAQAAQNKGQGHLLAISQRTQLSEVVTDVLLERGDRTVVRSTAGNEGARFSPSGFSTLVDRSAQDEVLAETVCNRTDVPEKELGRLLEAAPDGVRQKLMGTVVDADLATAVTPEPHGVPSDYVAAEERLSALHAAGKLDAETIDRSARKGALNEAIVGLALLAGIPIPLVEKAVYKRDYALFMILAKGCQLTWSTVLQILTIRCQLHGREFGNGEFERALGAYGKVQPATAQRVVRFMRVRQQSGGRLPFAKHDSVSAPLN